MSFFQFLNHWWNLPWLIMLGLVAVFFVLQLVGLFGSDGEHHVEGPDHDIDHEVDHDVDHDAEADADHDADEVGTWQSTLAFFGVGRVPFMVIWVSMYLTAGFAGVFANRVFFVLSGGNYAWWFFPIDLLIAFVVGLIAVLFFSRIAARFVDTGGKGSTSKHELSGKLGVVASQQVDARFGEVRVRDDHGQEQLVHGRVRLDEKPLPRGAKVVLVDWDADSGLFWVTACPELDSDGSGHDGRSDDGTIK